MSDTGRLVDVDATESWALVGQQSVCRIAWTSGDGPVVIPVNHVVHAGALWVRTTAYSKMVREVDDVRVAVLVDDLDRTTHLGWSVQLRGIAQVHYHAEEVPEPVRALQTWAPGTRALWVEVQPDQVTGRRLVAAD